MSEEYIELVNPECNSVRTCFWDNNCHVVIAPNPWRIVRIVEPSRHYRGNIIRYRIPANYYVVHWYRSNSGKAYITPVYPKQIPPSVFEIIKHLVLSYMGYEKVIE